MTMASWFTICWFAKKRPTTEISQTLTEMNNQILSQTNHVLDKQCLLVSHFRAWKMANSLNKSQDNDYKSRKQILK